MKESNRYCIDLKYYMIMLLMKWPLFQYLQLFKINETRSLS